MTTCPSSPRENEPDLSVTGTTGPTPPSAHPAAVPGPHPEDPPGIRPGVSDTRPVDQEPARPGADERTQAPYDEPVSDLVHAAVADRPVEDVTRLAVERQTHADRPPPSGATPPGTEREPGVIGRPILLGGARMAAVRGSRRIRHPRLRGGDRTPGRVNGPASWSSGLAALALAGCGVAHFPLHRDGESLRIHAFALGLSVLCTALALLLVVRPGVMALAVAVLVPAASAAAQVYGGSSLSAALARVVDLALAPPWFTAAAAVCAALAALTALVVHVVSPFPGRRWAVWPAPDESRMAE